MTLRLRLPATYEPERRYIAELVFARFLGLDVEFEVGGDGVAVTDGERTVELADVLFRTPRDAWLSPSSLPATPLAERDGIPVVYGDGPSVDILGSIFFFLTRYEEVALPDRDDRDRFPRAASLAARAGFVERPLVDEYVDLLWSDLVRVWPRLERPRSVFRILPSHDVDVVSTPLRWAAGDVVHRRDPALALRRAAGAARRTLDPAWSFDVLMDESERRGLRSAFYFIANPCGPPGGADYRLEDPAILKLLRRIADRGHEIGLHPSYDTYRDPARLAAEAESLRRALAAAGVDQPELGGRQHWLRWANPVTWRAWEAAGLAYDSTLGWPDAVGFRASCAREYPVFDLEARRTLALTERPLVVMDSAASVVTAAHADPSAIDRVKAACRRHGGDFTVLWHNEWVRSRAQRALLRHALD